MKHVLDVGGDPAQPLPACAEHLVVHPTVFVRDEVDL